MAVALLVLHGTSESDLALQEYTRIIQMQALYLIKHPSGTPTICICSVHTLLLQHHALSDSINLSSTSNLH